MRFRRSGPALLTGSVVREERPGVDGVFCLKRVSTATLEILLTHPLGLIACLLCSRHARAQWRARFRVSDGAPTCQLLAEPCLGLAGICEQDRRTF